MAEATTTTPNNNSSRPRRLTASAPPPRTPASSRPAQVLSYMHRPPRIVPNYGKKPRGTLPKSSVSRVLLYDNVTQQQMLHVKMTHLRHEQRKTGRLMDMHRRSFIVRRLQKEQQMAETALHVDHELLERGFANGNKAANTNSKTRGESHRNFNPYVESEEDASEKASPYIVEHHVTSQLTGEITADDATIQNGDGEEKGETPLPFLSVDRRRAITSDCLGAPTASPVPRVGGQRPVYTAVEPRELMGQNALPHIHPTNDKVVLHVDNHQRNGLTRILHTFPSHNSWVGSGNEKKGRGVRHGGGSRTTEDERYRKLEKMLVRIEPPNEGYLELSPSFHSPRQTISFSRPSSFHSPLHRRRSSSSCSSLSPGSFSIQVQDL